MTIRQLEGSKKFGAAVIATVLAMIGLILGLSNIQLLVLIGPLTTYILAQGMADHGKEATRIYASHLREIFNRSRIALAPEKETGDSSVS